MAFKILGQAAPTANTNTTVYTVASGKFAVLSTVVICKRGSLAATYRLAVVPSGESLGAQHYIAYDAVLPAYSSDYHRGGFTAAAGDSLIIRCSTADYSISVFGDES